MTPRTRGLLAALALLGGAALLVTSHALPPRTLCVPLLAPGALTMAGAQVMGLLGLLLLARMDAGSAVMGAAATAWVLLASAALLPRMSGGHWEAIGAPEAARALICGLALALLLAGLAGRLRDARGLALAAGLLACFAAGLGAAMLTSSRAADRVILSYARLDAAATTLLALSSGDQRLPPGRDVELALVAESLPLSARTRLESHDAWGAPILYTNEGGTWRLVSRGADHEAGPRAEGPIRSFADDLVIEKGSPVAWPERPCGDGPSAGRATPKDLRATPLR